MTHPTYTHYAKPADVWKHLALCEILVNEHPSVYVETNSGCAEYVLSRTPEQQYGIYHFIEKAQDMLLRSTYYTLEQEALRDNKYIGSPGLALAILGKQANRFVFYDLEIAALTNVAAFATRHSLWDRIRTIRQDSIPGMNNLLPQLPLNTLVHIDPYTIDQPSANGCDYLDVFIQAAEQGLKCVLWYGFHTLSEKRYLHEFMKKKLSGRHIGNLLGIELIMDVIQESDVLCNPGILGSGLLTCHLSKESTAVLHECSKHLVGLYEDTQYGGFSGTIYPEIVF